MATNKHTYTEADLDGLISQHLHNCEGYTNVCQLLATTAGKQRVKDKVKQLLFEDGLTDIGACLAQIESQLMMDPE